MRNIIKLLVLLIFQTTFAHEIYLTSGSTEVDLQNAIDDSTIGTIYIRTNIQISTTITITTDKVLNFSTKNKLIIENTVLLQETTKSTIIITITFFIF